MNIKALRLLAAAGLAASLSACAATTNLLEAPGDTTFGEANRLTMMAQVVDPDPQYDEPAVANGETGAAAVERYRNGEVYKPVTQSTSDNTGSTGPN